MEEETISLEKPRKASKIYGIHRFENKEIEVVKADRIKCIPDSTCVKFIVVCVMSLLTLSLGATLVIVYHDNETLLMLGTNLVSINISLWLKSPSFKTKSKIPPSDSND